jgi:hypothetical protein
LIVHKPRLRGLAGQQPEVDILPIPTGPSTIRDGRRETNCWAMADACHARHQHHGNPFEGGPCLHAARTGDQEKAKVVRQPTGEWRLLNKRVPAYSGQLLQFFLEPIRRLPASRCRRQSRCLWRVRGQVLVSVRERGDHVAESSSVWVGSVVDRGDGWIDARHVLRLWRMRRLGRVLRAGVHGSLRADVHSSLCTRVQHLLCPCMRQLLCTQLSHSGLQPLRELLRGKLCSSLCSCGGRVLRRRVLRRRVLRRRVLRLLTGSPLHARPGARSGDGGMGSEVWMAV